MASSATAPNHFGSARSSAADTGSVPVPATESSIGQRIRDLRISQALGSARQGRAVGRAVGSGIGSLILAILLCVAIALIACGGAFALWLIVNTVFEPQVVAFGQIFHFSPAG